MSISKNYLLNVVMLITTILFPMITFPYVSRILMPEYLGKVAFSQSIATYFITGALLGIPIYSIRELSKYKKDLDEFKKIFTELLLIGFLGSIISFILFQIVINCFQNLKEYKSILNIFSFQIIFSFMSVDYVFIVLESHKRRVLRGLIVRALSIFLMFYLVKNELDYLKYVMIIVLPEILARALDLYYIRQYLKLDSNISLKRHLNAIFILFLTTISISLYDQIDSTMLGLILSDKEVGLYSSSVKMTRVLIPLISSLSIIIGPQLIQSIKIQDKKEIFRKIDIFLDFNFFVGTQLIYLLFILSEDIILLFSGKQYLEAALTMKVILPIILFISIGNFMGSRVLTGNNLEKIPLKCNSIALLLNIIMNIYLIPRYSYLGAGIATLLTEAVNCFLKCLNVKKLYPNYIFLTLDRIKYTFIGGFIAILFYSNRLNYIINNQVYKIFIIGLIYVVLYISILFLLKDKIIKKYLKIN